VKTFPAGKQKRPCFKIEKWTSGGLCMDFTIMSMVAKVTVRAPPHEVHVGRSSQGPLLMTPKKSLRGPHKVHLFEFSKTADIVYNKLPLIPTVLHGLVG
jgi:hypothetical protein